MEAFLKAEGLVKRYGHINALRGIDLQVDRGDSVVLLGPNGAGKSTLLGVLAGRVRPTEGQVILQGETQGKTLGKSALARSLTGYLGHSSLLYQGLTARENLLFYGKLYGVEDSAERSDEMLNFMGLWERRDDKVGGFSRGMEQRLSIARSLLHDPQLILLDEPFSGLDYQSSRAFAHALRQLRDGRRTLIIATHDMAAVEDLGDRVTIMNRGRILHQEKIPLETSGSTPGNIIDLYAKIIPGVKK
ncbi:ABC transporter ATP-binding protein [bacterium]|nr:ABC transporter ATP-binding protein [bacterium]